MVINNLGKVKESKTECSQPMFKKFESWSKAMGFRSPTAKTKTWKCCWGRGTGHNNPTAGSTANWESVWEVQHPAAMYTHAHATKHVCPKPMSGMVTKKVLGRVWVRRHGNELGAYKVGWDLERHCLRFKQSVVGQVW